MRILQLIFAGLTLAGCASANLTAGCTTDPSGFRHSNAYRFSNLDGRDIRLNLVKDVNQTASAKVVSPEYLQKYGTIFSTAEWKKDLADGHNYCLITISAPQGPKDTRWELLMFHELRHCFEGPYHTVDYLPRSSDTKLVAGQP